MQSEQSERLTVRIGRSLHRVVLAGIIASAVVAIAGFFVAPENLVWGWNEFWGLSGLFWVIPGALACVLARERERVLRTAILAGGWFLIGLGGNLVFAIG